MAKKNEKAAEIIYKVLGREFIAIRVLALAGLFIFGLIEFYGNMEMFRGMTMVFGGLFLALAMTTSLISIKLGRSENPHIRGVALKGEAAGFVVAGIIAGVWYLAGTDYTSARDVEADWKERQSAFQQSEDKVAARKEAVQARYDRCRGRNLGGFNKEERGALLGSCDELLAELRTIQGTVDKPASLPETAAQVGAKWKWFVRLLTLVALGITVLVIARLLWIAGTAQVDNSDMDPEPEPLTEGGNVQAGRGGLFRRLFGDVQKSRPAARAQSATLPPMSQANVQNLSAPLQAPLSDSEHSNVTVTSDSEPLNVTRIGLENLGKGFGAYPDQRALDRGKPLTEVAWRINRYRSGKKYTYILSVSYDELERLKRSDGEWGLAWLRHEIPRRRRTAEKIPVALEALAA